MIKVILITLLGAAALVLGGIYLFGGDDPQADSASSPQAVNTEALPWIEVLKPGVSDATRQLKTGDELRAPTIIKTNSVGLANIYFPNGSVARLDSNTELVLEQGSYNSADKTLRVEILLAVGHVWSKIFELATPQSLWEVRTANAVATVRGTAFGVEYIGDKTTVIGSEHTVSVTNLKQKTTATVLENQVMAITDGLVKVRAKKSLEEEWVERFESADMALEEKREEALREVQESTGVIETNKRIESVIEKTIQPVIQPVIEPVIESTRDVPDVINKAASKEVVAPEKIEIISDTATVR